MTLDHAHSVLILLRWMGWKLQPYDAPVDDAWAVDALTALVDAAARKALTAPVPAADVYSTFEAFCERLRGRNEAELVCEIIDRECQGDVVFNLPHLTAAFDRWKATRQEATR